MPMGLPPGLTRRAHLSLCAFLGVAGSVGCSAEHVIGSLGLGAAVHHPASSAAAVVIGDFDGDGHPDVVSQDRSGQIVCLMRGLGDGSLLPARCGQPVEPATALAVQRFPAGPASLLRAGASVSSWRANADGVFAKIASTPLAAPVVSQGLTVEDLDGDHRADVLVAESGPTQVEAMLSVPSGLISAGVYSLTTTPRATLYRDLDGDDHPELAVLLPNTVLLWGARGQATWLGCDSPQWNRPLGLWPVQHWLRSQSGQPGLPALMVFDASRGILGIIRPVPRSDFSFACGEVADLPGVTATAASYFALTTADLNGDGELELVLAAADGSLRVFRAGDGSVSRLAELDLGSAVSAIVAADLDHDDRPELIAVSERGDDILVIPNLFSR
jgi:hypothetical protein